MFAARKHDEQMGKAAAKAVIWDPEEHVKLKGTVTPKSFNL